MTNLNATHLLEKVFEFIAMTPDEKDWDVAKLKTNRPRQVRLQRIEALLVAFGLYERKSKGLFGSTSSIKTGIQSLLSGDFISNLDDATISAIDDYVTKQLNDPFFDRKISGGEVRFIYQYLIRYRKQVNTLQTFNSGWLEASGKLTQYAIGLTNTITANLDGKTEELDYLLGLIINPNGYSFTEQELIEKYSYPDVDLMHIDIDAM